MQNSKLNVLVLYVLLSYPLFYFSYKFCLPDFGGDDFFSYYSMYKSWDFNGVPCPFNMRIVSSFLIFLMNKTGFYYDTETVFHTVHPEYSQQVFFNAVFFNYLCVILTCFIIYKTVSRIAGNPFFAFLAGSLYLLGFGTIFFALKPISESCGILLLAWAFYLYLKRSNWIYAVFLLALFQREYLFISFAVLSLYDYIILKEKYLLGVVAGAVVFFGAYFVLRKTVFYTPHWDFQTSPATFFSTDTGIDLPSFIKQSVFISNLLFIYLLVIMHKKSRNMAFNRHYLAVTLLLLVQVMAMSVMARFGNSAGRYYYYNSPILIYYLFSELRPLLATYLRFKENV